MRTFLQILVITLALGGCSYADPQYTFSKVDMVPLGTLQLGDAAFVSPDVFEDLDLEQGTAVLLYTGQDKELQVYLYPIYRSADTVSMKRIFRDQLGVEPGSATVYMRVLDESEITIRRMDEEIRIESYPGMSEAWPRMVIGAPHGDCDLYTGEIVSRVAKDAGLPAVAAYGPRISYIGRWIDVNRPLQREPKPLFGIEPYRSWTAEAEAVYTEFRTNLLSANTTAREGDVPLDFYLDLHGHDLTVKTAEGDVYGRDLSECMARGFRLEEIRRIKQAFDEAFRSEYGEEAPPSYWGNMPEDRIYTVSGVEVEFFYSGLGGRVYGALNSGISRRCIHIETPNVLRVPEENRSKTARALAQFSAWLRDEMLPESLSTASEEERPASSEGTWLKAPAGEFTMGAAPGEGWSSQRPQRTIALDAFEVHSTEVTNESFAGFLNEKIESGAAIINSDQIIGDDGQKWADLWPGSPLSQLYSEGDKVVLRQGYEDYPVVEVSWYGAVAYAKSRGARLPTEAEWEYAAGWDPRAGKPVRWRESEDRDYTQLPAGNFMHSDYYERTTRQPGPTPVGQFPEGASPIGCLDTVGNVWEWTSDWYADYPDSDTTLQNPKGADQGTMKSIRGGAWDTEPSTATPVFRLGVAPHETLPTLGFRIVKSIE